MRSHNHYLKRIVFRTISHGNLPSIIRPSITADVLPIVISTSNSLLSSGQISTDDDDLTKDSRKEDSDLRKKEGKVRTRSDEERHEAPDYGNVSSKHRADILNNPPHFRAQRDRIEKFSDNNQQENVDVDTDLDKLYSLPRKSHDNGDADNMTAPQPNLELKGDVAMTELSGDHNQSLNRASILHSLELLSKRLDQVVSQSAGSSDRLDWSQPTVKIHIGRIEVRAVMPSSYSERKYARTERQQPSPAFSLNDYLKKRAGESI
jgi:hypothetical protein